MTTQIVNPEQCVRFLDSVLDAAGKLTLRVKMGQMFNCLLGLPTGHYVFDFRSRQASKEGRSLAARWGTEQKFMKGIGCNTSQKGNYSNFRNEMMSGAHVEGIDSSWFTHPPSSGRLTLDYVSTTRPRKGIHPLTDPRFHSLKKGLNLSAIAEASAREDLASASLESLGIPACVSLAHMKEACFAFLTSSHTNLSIYPPEHVRDVSRADYDPDARPVTPEILKEAKAEVSFPAIFPIGYYKLLELQLLLPSVWLSAHQAMDLVQCFPREAYLRVQAYISVFSRIVEFDAFQAKIIDEVFTEGASY